MAEYIEREAAKRELVSDYAYAAADLLDRVPAADVAPAGHGRWVPKNSRNPFSWRYCSECKHIVTAAQARVYQGCPVCLARMDGE